MEQKIAIVGASGLDAAMLAAAGREVPVTIMVDDPGPPPLPHEEVHYLKHRDLAERGLFDLNRKARRSLLRKKRQKFL